MRADLMVCFYMFLTGLFSSLIAVPALRQWALDTGSLDRPDNDRKVHSRATPRLGGVAIFLAFFFSVLMFKEFNLQVRAILAGSLIIFVTGLVDDLVGLSPKRKLAGQILACLVTVGVGGLYIRDLGNLFGGGNVVLPAWLAVPFTVFAVVGVINAINLIDGLDGLAGGVSVIALASFSLMDLHAGRGETMLLSAALIGAVLGFLKYNVYPARIFMGDVGSLLLGFLLGFFSVQLTQNPGQHVSPLVPVLILGVPILDTVWVMGRRLLSGKSPFVADRTHLHHKFLDLGVQHRFSVLIIYALATFWAVVAILMHEQPEYVLLAVYLIGSIVFYLGLRILLQHADRVPLPVRDSQISFRKSSLFVKLQNLADQAVPVLKGLMTLLVMLALAAGSRATLKEAMFAIGVTSVGVILLWLTRDPRNNVFHAFLYLSGLVLIVLLDSQAGLLLFGRVAVGQVELCLFVLMLPLVVFKIVFKREDELFLSTPFDFLILSMSLSLVVVGPEVAVSYNLPWLIGKAVVLFLGLKVVAVSGNSSARQVCIAMLSAMLLVAARGIG